MANRKIVLVDSCYPDFLRHVQLPEGDYSKALEYFLSLGFGTADFYSYNLGSLGWDAIDIITNYPELQSRWAQEHGAGEFGLERTLLAQIRYYQPEVVFFQDLSLLSPQTLHLLRTGSFGTRILAGQCSCPMPDENKVREFQILFTSFPHYLDRFKVMGVHGVYNPLAFEPRIWSRIPHPERDLGIVFVGGVGTPSHWTYGMKVLRYVAEAFGPTMFHCFGYGYESLDPLDPIRQCYRRPAWGLQMYELFARAKIVLNRHGEVAQGYTNNMRTYEATGCGAVLMTETSKNLHDLFRVWTEVISYDSPIELVAKLSHALAHDEDRSAIGQRGQQRTLLCHNYVLRMKTVNDKLLEMLQ